MDDPVPLDELAEHASGIRVAVIGGGVAGLVAALECARVGLDVTVFEAAERLGGTVQTVELDGIPADTGADCVAMSGAVVRLVDELGIGGLVVSPATETRWVVGLGGAVDAAPLPDDAVLGIPENMFGERTRAILGTAGAWRAYVDRLRPPLTIGHERRLGALVGTRMGPKARDRLVAPLSAGVYGAAPDDIDVDVAAPGLNAALTRTGSLSGAVATLRAQHDGHAPVRSLQGGMSRLVDAIADRLTELGARIRTGAPVSSLERIGPAADAPWIVHTARDKFDTTVDAPDPEAFDAVIVAVPEASARALIHPVAPGLDVAPAGGAPWETVTLVVDAPGLDAGPRGAEALAIPGSRAAGAVTHLTAKWGIGDGCHVLRVTFGGPAPATAALDDTAAIELALAEATALMGTEMTRIRAGRRSRFLQAPPRAVIGRREIAERARKAVESVPRLAATGAWLAGSGLAQVVDDAVTTADRLRRRVLFSD